MHASCFLSIPLLNESISNAERKHFVMGSLFGITSFIRGPDDPFPAKP